MRMSSFPPVNDMGGLPRQAALASCGHAFPQHLHLMPTWHIPASSLHRLPEVRDRATAAHFHTVLHRQLCPHHTAEAGTRREEEQGGAWGQVTGWPVSHLLWSHPSPCPLVAVTTPDLCGSSLRVLLRLWSSCTGWRLQPRAPCLWPPRPVQVCCLTACSAQN